MAIVPDTLLDKAKPPVARGPPHSLVDAGLARADSTRGARCRVSPSYVQGMDIASRRSSGLDQSPRDQSASEDHLGCAAGHVTLLSTIARRVVRPLVH